MGRRREAGTLGVSRCLTCVKLRPQIQELSSLNKNRFTPSRKGRGIQIRDSSVGAALVRRPTASKRTWTRASNAMAFDGVVARARND